MDGQRVAFARGMLNFSTDFGRELTIFKDERKMALFAQYAMGAAQEALEDAEWEPTAEEDLEATVRPTSESGALFFADIVSQGVYIGSGIGSLHDVVNTTLDFDKGVMKPNHRPLNIELNLEQGYKKVSPLFVPRLLINLAAGHISMRFGFKVRSSAISIWISLIR
jgi:3-oxoacyl-[acyl-carrier-protein] synthase II